MSNPEIKYNKVFMNRLAAKAVFMKEPFTALYIDSKEIIGYNHIIPRSMEGLMVLEYALINGYGVFILEENES